MGQRSTYGKAKIYLKKPFKGAYAYGQVVENAIDYVILCIHYM